MSADVVLKMTTVLKEMRIPHPTVLQKGTDFTYFKFKLKYLRIRVNFDFRGFIFFPPSFNISTQQEATFASRRQKITEVCKKYKMNTGKPSSEIFNTILCFSKYEVSTYIYVLWQYRLWSYKSGDTELEIFLPKNQHFWQLAECWYINSQFSTFYNFLWVCRFLGKNISK